MPKASKNTASSTSHSLVPLLSEGISACHFDLDGVLTKTAEVHAKAWKEMFAAFLLECAETSGDPFRPYEIATDYVAYIGRKP